MVGEVAGIEIGAVAVDEVEHDSVGTVAVDEVERVAVGTVAVLEVERVEVDDVGRVATDTVVRTVAEHEVRLCNENEEITNNFILQPFQNKNKNPEFNPIKPFH